jgi:hypothetical protein
MSRLTLSAVQLMYALAKRRTASSGVAAPGLATV